MVGRILTVPVAQLPDPVRHEHLPDVRASGDDSGSAASSAAGPSAGRRPGARCRRRRSLTFFSLAGLVPGRRYACLLVDRLFVTVLLFMCA